MLTTTHQGATVLARHVRGRRVPVTSASIPWRRFERLGPGWHIVRFGEDRRWWIAKEGPH